MPMGEVREPREINDFTGARAKFIVTTSETSCQTLDRVPDLDRSGNRNNMCDCMECDTVSPSFGARQSRIRSTLVIAAS